VYTNRIREKLIPPLSTLLKSRGFALKENDGFWRETENTTEYLELCVVQRTLEYKIYFELSITLKNVSKVLVDTFSFQPHEVPFSTLHKSSLYMTPKGRWEVKGPKGADTVIDEILTFVSTGAFSWFDKNTDLESVKETLLERSFNNWRWRWHSILAICWMTRDSSNLNLLLQKAKAYIETTAPDEIDFHKVYAQFRSIDPGFFPAFTFDDAKADQTAKAICADEKSKWDARIERTLKFGKIPQASERCTFYLIYGTSGALHCNAAGWESCLTAIEPVVACTDGKRFTSRTKDKSSKNGEFRSMQMKVRCPEAEIPNLLLIVEKQCSTNSESRFSFNPSILLIVCSNLAPKSLEIAETCARMLANIANAVLFVKQERPYWLEQSMDYGICCPEELGIETLRRRSWNHRRGDLIDTLEGTWHLIPPE